MTQTLTELRNLQGGEWTRRGLASTPGQDAAYDVQPGQSVQSRLDAAPEGGIVRLAPGTYPLTKALILKDGQQLIGPSQGYATFRGDITLTGWVKDGAYWRLDGKLPPDYVDANGQCEVEAGAGAFSCRRREQLWLDDTHLTRVMGKEYLTPGTFFQDFQLNRIWMADDPTGRRVEMSMTTNAINTPAKGGKLYRLEFRRFASAPQAGAVVLGGPDWEVAYSLFRENHALGLHFRTSDRSWIHHNSFTENGQLGMGCYKSHDVVIEDNSYTRNNTDGFWRADWESGGLKVTYSNRTIVRRNVSNYNNGVGIWFDIDNVDPDIYENSSNFNYGDGIRYEISQGAKIHHNDLEGNGFVYATGGGKGADFSLFAVAAINVNSSPNVEIYENRVGLNQNGIVGQMRTRKPSPSGYGQPDLNNLYVHDNTITMTGGTLFGERVSGVGTLGQGANATNYYNTKGNRFERNRYVVTALSDRKFAWNGTYMTFADYQNTAKQDVGGSVKVAPRPGFRVTNAADDGHWTMAGSSSFTSDGATSLIGDYDSTNYGRATFLRFLNVNIPKGATITAATLDLRLFGMDTAIPQMLIAAHKVGDSPRPTGRTEMNARPVTTAKVQWAPTTWTINTWQSTPSIVSVIQELVNQPGWVPGGAVTIFIQPDPLTWSTQKRVSIRTFENNPDDAAGLVVSWVGGS